MLKFVNSCWRVDVCIWKDIGGEEYGSENSMSLNESFHQTCVKSLLIIGRIETPMQFTTTTWIDGPPHAVTYAR